MAEHLDRMPKYAPEEVNVCAVVDHQRIIDGSLENLTARLDNVEASLMSSRAEDTNHVLLSKSIQELDKRVTEALISISSRIENTNSTMSIFAEQVNKIRGPPVHSQAQADTSLNLVIIGVPEQREPVAWRNKVEDILQFVLGRNVECSDMFRVGGKYRAGHTRPIIIKLRSIWDHRLLLASRHKLKDYSSNRIYINADEPLETRRKSTFDRLVRKYEFEGKHITTDNGRLIVEDELVFSIENGYVKKN